MQETSGYDPNYVMGRSTAETDRLKRQSQLYDVSTWQLLKEAGLSRGMKVLDVGSGAGNVSFIAAGLVGESGAVVGVDSNPRHRRGGGGHGALARPEPGLVPGR
ncbi:methyltransferase domain-containing protein [Bradyrhizobium sp. Pear77]|uniref:methyltransferase domain-containing protein n=1 Tax=Bradyrhizobium altum TaxID=1571202 RepID=UPI0028A18F01|nr:methyltransferase domain-containing protein [Bradyrhizobium altum]MCC8954524.1 methyltransferase domain-containing protein [Bradyrhizobium altum]